jgi:hypothetical protein
MVIELIERFYIGEKTCYLLLSLFGNNERVGRRSTEGGYIYLHVHNDSATDIVCQADVMILKLGTRGRLWIQA